MMPQHPILTLAAAPWRFGTPVALLLLFAVPLVAVLLWLAFLRRRNALKLFEGVTPQDSRPTVPRAVLKIALIAIGLSSLTIAIARPQADPIEENVTVRGRDIVFLVDVSRSMLSRDAVPSRLGRAKLWINDLVNTLKGDRVGLVAFAGVPVVKCPLTLDLGYFRMALDELSPASVPRGGTLIGDAIRKTLTDVFEPGEGRYRDIILITDGEDQGSFPAEAAKKAAEMGIRIIVIGIGSELEGSLVPAEEENAQRFVEHDGQKVRSHMDGSTLAAIAEAATQAGGANGGGVFLNVGTGTMDLDKVYHDLIGSAEQRETETKANVIYRELFAYFLGLAVLCLLLEPMIGGRSRMRRLKTDRESARALPRTGSVVAIFIIGVCFSVASVRADGTKPSSTPSTSSSTAAPNTLPSPPSAKQPTPPHTSDSLYNSGREMFLAGKYAEAAEQFRQSDLGATDSELSARARFNLGQSLLKQAESPPAAGAKPDPAQSIAQLDAAARAFRSALAAKPDDAEAARNVEIARRLMQQKEQEQQKQQQKQQESGDNKDSKDKKDEKGDSKQGQSKDQKKSDEKKQSGDQSGKGGESKQHQENADKLKDLAKKQSQAADKSKDASQAKTPEEKEKKEQEAKAEQGNVNKDTKQEQKKLDESKEKSSQQAKDQLEQAQKEQEAASESLEKNDPKKAEEHQRKAAEKLEQAAESEQKAADEAKQAEAAKKDQEKQNQAKEEKPKFNDAASQLLDKERKQREARQQILRALRGKPQPVDKDW